MSCAIATGRPAEDRTERFYRPELDILRFLAFFGVFIYHVPPGSIFFYRRHGALGSLGVSGCFGVDLFFTLSGYLITRLLLREREQTGDINLRAFYARRILRIWPLYFFYLALEAALPLLPSTFTSAPPFTIISVPPAHFGCFIFLMTFLFNYSHCLWVSSISLLAPLWTISVEEQFYLLWPLVLRRIPANRLIVVPFVMFATAIGARLLWPYFNFDVAVWTNTLCRLDPISAGILIAILPSVNLRPVSRLLLVLIGIASWFFAAHYCGLPLHAGALATAVGYPAVAIGSTAFLLAALGTTDDGRAGVLKRALIYLGKISYGLYVYNFLAILGCQVFMFRVASGWFVREGWPFWMAWPCYLMLAFGTNVLLAAVSYRWLESPFLRLKGRFTRVPSRPV